VAGIWLGVNAGNAVDSRPVVVVMRRCVGIAGSSGRHEIIAANHVRHHPSVNIVRSVNGQRGSACGKGNGR